MTAPDRIAVLPLDEARGRLITLAGLHAPAGPYRRCTECGNPWPCQSRRIAVGGAK
jgi:hypothetical protein